MKPIKPGTKWAVRWLNGSSGTRATIWEKDAGDHWGERQWRLVHSDHASALTRLDWARARNPKFRDAITLVRILPRTDHKAEAERLRRAMVYVRKAIENQLAHNEKNGTAKSTAEHLAAIDTLLAEALRDPGELGKGVGT